MNPLKASKQKQVSPRSRSQWGHHLSCQVLANPKPLPTSQPLLFLWPHQNSPWCFFKEPSLQAHGWIARIAKGQRGKLFRSRDHLPYRLWELRTQDQSCTTSEWMSEVNNEWRAELKCYPWILQPRGCGGGWWLIETTAPPPLAVGPGDLTSLHLFPQLENR